MAYNQKRRIGGLPDSDMDREQRAIHRIEQATAGERVTKLEKRVKELEEIIESNKKEYDILIRYSTGDSFHTYKTEGHLGGHWKDIQVVRDNLKRIQEHMKWLNATSWKKATAAPEFMNEIEDRNLWNRCIPLRLDNGNVWQIGVFWHGTFETIDEAEIVETNKEQNIVVSDFY